MQAMSHRQSAGLARGNPRLAAPGRKLHTRSPQRAHLQSRRAASTDTEASTKFATDSTFYSILGVAPDAEAKDIKRAYYSLMREVHPDRTSDQYSTELCTVLNEIYDVLMDEDRRRTYDVISGFSPDSENPFLDCEYPRDQVFVDECTCIGCGKCARLCPSTFVIEGSKYGRARVISQESDQPDDIQIAIESCPVDCIHWVSTPQLSLLEAALGTMGRVEVYIMMRYGRSTGEDVFTVASKAWEKRMAAFRQRREQFYFDWSALSFRERSEAAQDPGHQQPQDKDARQIANLAANAARAARLWRTTERQYVIKGLLPDGQAQEA